MGVRRVVPDVRVESAQAPAASRAFCGAIGLEAVMDLAGVVTMASPGNPTAQVTLATRDENGRVVNVLSHR